MSLVADWLPERYIDYNEVIMVMQVIGYLAIEMKMIFVGKKTNSTYNIHTS